MIFASQSVRKEEFILRKAHYDIFNILWLPASEQYVQYQATKWAITAVSDVGRLFKHLPVTRLARDVKVQPIFILAEAQRRRTIILAESISNVGIR